LEAVELSITTPWSNGPIEGHINRLKAIKRQMYGRAGFELLKARVLPWDISKAAWIAIDDEALAHLSPIGWDHVNLTGDYTWQAAGRLRKGSFRPLRPFAASNE
jgi:hypothetical protein